MDKGDAHAEWRAFGLFYHDDRGLVKRQSLCRRAQSGSAAN